MSDNTYQSYEDEIDLYRFWQAVRKRYKLILALFLLMVIGAKIYTTHFMAKIYQITATIKLGRVDAGDGRLAYSATLDDIQQIVSTGSFTKKIVSALNLDELRYTSSINNGISIQANKNSELINIVYETSEPERGVQILDKLIDEIQAIYAPRAENKRKALDAEIQKSLGNITLLENKIQGIKLDIENQNEAIRKKQEIIKSDSNLAKQEQLNFQRGIDRLKKRAVMLNESKSKLLQTLATLEANTRDLLKEKSDMAKNPGKEGVLSSILLTNNLQQNLSMISQTYEQLKNYEIELDKTQELMDQYQGQKDALDETIIKQTATSEIELIGLRQGIQKLKLQQENDIPAEIKKINKEIDKLRTQQELVEGIVVIAEPDYVKKAIKPKKTMIVVISGFVALFGGVFLAFVREWQTCNENK